MLPIVIPTACFHMFTSTVLRDRRILNAPKQAFAEFSSLVEALVLYDRCHYYNVGAVHFEWKDGTIIPGKGPGYHPYEPFHSLEFLTDAPDGEPDPNPPLVPAGTAEERKRIIGSHFSETPVSTFAVDAYLRVFHGSYAGRFGAVSVKEFPLIQGLVPKLYRYKDSDKPIVQDTLIERGYALIKETYETKLRELEAAPLGRVVIPPVTATLLSRLPDDCRDPHTVISELVALREELAALRQRFSQLEEIVFSDNATIVDYQHVERAIRADAEALKERFDARWFENVWVRFLTDKLSSVAKMLVKWDEITIDDVVDLVGDAIPTIRDRVRLQRPSLLFDMAMKSRQIAGYGSLAQRKLGLNIG